MMIFFNDMKQLDLLSQSTRDVRRVGDEGLVGRCSRLLLAHYHKWQTGRIEDLTIAVYLEAQENLRDQKLMALHPLLQDMVLEQRGQLEREFNERMEEPSLQRWCARFEATLWFRLFSYAVFFSNASWICIQSEWHTDDIRHVLDVSNRMVEAMFCVLFTSELLIRFFAFKVKCHCLKNAWFIVDAIVVLTQIVEFVAVERLEQATNLDNRSDLFKFYRITRLGRIVRVVRVLIYFPQVVTLLKGIFLAFRSLFATLVLLVVQMFVSGIFFTTMTRIDPGLERFSLRDNDMSFETVSSSMRVLFLRCLLLDDVSYLLNDMSTDRVGWFPFVYLFFFIFLGNFTLLNMVIGFMCGVAARVSEEESEASNILFLKGHLGNILEAYDLDGNQSLNQEEFKLLLCDPEFGECLRSFGTDLATLVALTGVLFQDAEEDSKLRLVRGNSLVNHHDCAEEYCCTPRSHDDRTTVSFAEILHAVQQLQGSNHCRVTDLVAVREYISSRMDRLEAMQLRRMDGHAHNHRRHDHHGHGH